MGLSEPEPRPQCGSCTDAANAVGRAPAEPPPPDASRQGSPGQPIPALAAHDGSGPATRGQHRAGASKSATGRVCVGSSPGPVSGPTGDGGSHRRGRCRTPCPLHSQRRGRLPTRSFLVTHKTCPVVSLACRKSQVPRKRRGWPWGAGDRHVPSAAATRSLCPVGEGRHLEHLAFTAGTSCLPNATLFPIPSSCVSDTTVFQQETRPRPAFESAHTGPQPRSDRTATSSRRPASDLAGRFVRHPRQGGAHVTFQLWSWSWLRHKNLNNLVLMKTKGLKGRFLR